MIVVMKEGCTKAEIENVMQVLRQKGFGAHLSEGEEQTIVGVIGPKDRVRELGIENMSGVEKLVPVSNPFKLASRAFHPDDTKIKVLHHVIGGDEPTIIAGPCSVESREGLIEIAKAVKASGAQWLRGGAYKPRSSPYSFQGLGEEGLKYLADAREATGLGIVSEIMEPGLVELVASYVDVLQIGARNMQNFALLKAVGKTDKPVLLKRGFSNTIEEWLMSAEYILAEGNPNVILCERGIRTFETYTRNTLDLNAVPVVQHLSHLPVMVDPSHGVGHARYVATMARASIAAGAAGVIVEVHPKPEAAWSDGSQTLTLQAFDEMAGQLRQLHALTQSFQKTTVNV
ncbi:3-deoxy-7-phosphoheptulonate synthase [Alicyclobacillus acidoterrestris]|uniref:3-deoxy-7-phosphoheptulonate synthase n=1 Tax=Alicyclobacillus acidoterrestris (strain ATCC 49025 / DSM 3922 / CIP 106132 / NCIMB 13137 / GD3B) TaxID=1356854 RepID=T0BD05_ALIAG|nr:3-deoxy-7-phosphoheptulonate synthase [Alicyclobacillus acidoterrestris]EPZ41913.1 3-deoxy-7-phosphoheptulonate synthase [Alicyclobacillus acidoterrestris ATCC 49025]UNO47369.1 3-deoxy-7-phosphoheptulonate synthase [Alicyclobacillus acidoterrestris]